MWDLEMQLHPRRPSLNFRRFSASRAPASASSGRRALGGYGIDDNFIKQVRTKVTKGTSGLFLLLGAVTANKVVEAFEAAPHFEFIARNLMHEQEQKRNDALG